MSMNIIHENMNANKRATDIALLNLNKQGDDDPWDEYEPHFSPKTKLNFSKNSKASKVKANKENNPDKNFQTAFENHAKNMYTQNDSEINGLLLGPEARKNLDKREEIRNRMQNKTSANAKPNQKSVPMKTESDLESQRSKKIPSRTLEQFLHEQDRYQRVKEQKVDRLKSQIEEESQMSVPGRPQINEVSFIFNSRNLVKLLKGNKM